MCPGGSYGMNLGTMDGAYRGSYGETDGFLVRVLVSLYMICFFFFKSVNLYFDTSYYFACFLGIFGKESILQPWVWLAEETSLGSSLNLINHPGKRE